MAACVVKEEVPGVDIGRGSGGHQHGRVPKTPFIAEVEMADVQRTTSKKPSAAVLADVEMNVLELDEVLMKEESGIQSQIMRDPDMVGEYADEIYAYLRHQELVTMVDPFYMDAQGAHGWDMRCKLVNYVAEIHEVLKMKPETLFLAINLLDRFCAQRRVSLEKYQLAGLTAFFVACKYEEVRAVRVEVIVHFGAGKYSKEEVLRAERYMLGVLKFVTGCVTPLECVRRMSTVDSGDPRPRILASFLAEVTMTDHQFLACPPSLIGAACMYLARGMLRTLEIWGKEQARLSGYRLRDVLDTKNALWQTLRSEYCYDKIFHKQSNREVADFTLKEIRAATNGF
ncbi:G2/mitotic-specific cyclin [Irineochytrium annulatum]|nr:G2/mitotic-specific cyclin [Irineochytrium annulatum]